MTLHLADMNQIPVGLGLAAGSTSKPSEQSIGPHPLSEPAFVINVQSPSPSKPRSEKKIDVSLKTGDVGFTKQVKKAKRKSSEGEKIIIFSVDLNKYIFHEGQHSDVSEHDTEPPKRRKLVLKLPEAPTQSSTSIHAILYFPNESNYAFYRRLTRDS